MKSPRCLDNRNSRASESKALSSLKCSAERSRESTKLTFCCVGNSRATPCGRKLVCEYRPSRPGFKSFPSEKGKVLIKRVQ